MQLGGGGDKFAMIIVMSYKSYKMAENTFSVEPFS